MMMIRWHRSVRPLLQLLPLVDLHCQEASAPQYRLPPTIQGGPFVKIFILIFWQLQACVWLGLCPEGIQGIHNGFQVTDDKGGAEGNMIDVSCDELMIYWKQASYHDDRMIIIFLMIRITMICVCLAWGMRMTDNDIGDDCIDDVGDDVLQGEFACTWLD